MPTASIDYVAVLVAALIFMVVGFVWYALPVFGRSWMKEIGLKEKDLKAGPGTGYALAMLGGLVQAYVLAHFIDYAGADSWEKGAATGLWIGVGFIAMAIAANYIFAKRSATLWLIDSGYFVVSLALAGALLAVWQ